MSCAGHHDVSDQGLVFFGEVVAAQSHELTNVLNIINELAGLQQDLLAVGKEGSTTRVAELGGRVQAQVERGRQIVAQVNQFAHSVDLPWVLFEVNEALARVFFFAERVARLNRVELGFDPPAEPLAIESNPFCLQQAVFVILRLAIVAADSRRQVRLGYVSCEGGVEIWVRSADPIVVAPEQQQCRAALERLMGQVGGEILESPRHVDDDAWRLFVPSKSRGSIEKA